MSTKNNPGDLSLTITRIFNAPRHLVFRAWTEKELMDRWSAPRGFTISDSGGELRTGGKWHCCMVGPDGTKYPVAGVYREIVQDELLVFTHVWDEGPGAPQHETVVTVHFADEGDKTKVTFEQSIFKSVESRDGHKGGWTESMDRLDELLPELKAKE